MLFIGFKKNKYVPKVTRGLLLSCVYFGEIEVSAAFCHPKIVHFRGCKNLAGLFVPENKPLLKTEKLSEMSQGCFFFFKVIQLLDFYKIS